MCQMPNGILKANFFLEFNELEYITANTTTEAVKEALVCADLKRWSFLLMKWTETFVIRSRTAKRDLILYDQNYICLSPKIFDETFEGKDPFCVVQLIPIACEIPVHSLSSTTVTLPPPSCGEAASNRLTRGWSCSKSAIARRSLPLPCP